MILRFFARDGQLVPLPGFVPQVGQSPQYVGRTHDVQLRGFPATAEPHAFDSERQAAACKRLAKLTLRDRSLWPADEETAKACGVPFVAVRVVNGVAEPVATETNDERKPRAGRAQSALSEGAN